MKKSNRIFLIISFFLLLVIITFVLLSVLKKDKFLYGTFECINELGEKSVVKIEKESVYFENVDYENIEKFEAIFFVAEMNFDNDTNEEMTKEQKEQIKAELREDWDFESEFDKKKNSSIEIHENEFDENEYVLIVGSSETGIRVRMTINREDKTCNIMGSESGLYNYVK